MTLIPNKISKDEAGVLISPDLPWQASPFLFRPQDIVEVYAAPLYLFIYLWYHSMQECLGILWFS